MGAQLDRYIYNQLYWVLHAPRQTGKTTFLQSWMREINAGEEALACYVSVEVCQQFPAAEDAIPAICHAIREFAAAWLDPSFVPPLPEIEPTNALSRILTDWAALVAPKPLVVLFDEVDVLQDQAMISFLRQLRGGFARRGVGRFPVSVALVGMRDLRDYLIRSKAGEAVNPGSPFNIKHASANIASFSREDVFVLARQHTKAEGQPFSDDALNEVYDQTQGQPWLTNAILQGDDFRLALDMGLVSVSDGVPRIANPIYREIVGRVLSEPYQLSIPEIEFQWRKPGGTLDMDALLREFQRFWRRHGDLWEAKADYTEAFPHLSLMAFLQRVVTGGGRLEREYAAGRGRVDLAVCYAGTWWIVEIKLVHPADGRETTVIEGLRQIERYRATIDPEAPAYLVVFDRTSASRATPWAERLTWEVRETPGGEVTVVGG